MINGCYTTEEVIAKLERLSESEIELVGLKFNETHTPNYEYEKLFSMAFARKRAKKDTKELVELIEAVERNR